MYLVVVIKVTKSVIILKLFNMLKFFNCCIFIVVKSASLSGWMDVKDVLRIAAYSKTNFDFLCCELIVTQYSAPK